MVASPADLASGRPFTGIEAQPAASAVQRYLTDKVKQPPAPTASPFAPSTGGGDSGGGAAGGPPGTACPSGTGRTLPSAPARRREAPVPARGGRQPNTSY